MLRRRSCVAGAATPGPICSFFIHFSPLSRRQACKSKAKLSGVASTVSDKCVEYPCIPEGRAPNATSCKGQHLELLQYDSPASIFLCSRRQL